MHSTRLLISCPDTLLIWKQLLQLGPILHRPRHRRVFGVLRRSTTFLLQPPCLLLSPNQLIRCSQTLRSPHHTVWRPNLVAISRTPQLCRHKGNRRIETLATPDFNQVRRPMRPRLKLQRKTPALVGIPRCATARLIRETTSHLSICRQLRKHRTQ